MMQNVLIQVQQQKVEMQRTMAMLDKLMRSNEVRGPCFDNETTLK
jgi:hypothetical protein